MKKTCYIVCLFCLFPYILWSQVQTLEGQVVDANTKQPLSAVVMELMRGEEVLQSIKTDVSGRYKFIVEAAAYDLRACKQNYVLQIGRNIVAWEGLENQLVIALTQCNGLCSEEIYQVPKTLYRQNGTGTSTRFSANELRGSH